MLFCSKAAVTQSSTAPLCSIYPSASLFFFCSKICLVFPILWEALAAGWDRGCCSEVCNACGGRGGVICRNVVL